MQRSDTLKRFSELCIKDKINAIRWLMHLKTQGNIACYGAAAKGVTYLNYLGLSRDLIDFCVDDTPRKQGRFMPGSRIPIVSQATLQEKKPQFLLVLPWNHFKEIQEKTNYIKTWGGKHIARRDDLCLI